MSGQEHDEPPTDKLYVSPSCSSGFYTRHIELNERLLESKELKQGEMNKLVRLCRYPVE